MGNETRGKSLQQIDLVRYTADMSEVLLPQIALFEAENIASGLTELFPAVWLALEGIASPRAADRHQNLDRLLELDAPRFSPLVAYVLATRLIDPDLKFRKRVVQALGDLLIPVMGERPPDSVRGHLKGHCSVMGRGTVLAVLEVAEIDAAVNSQIAALFNLCSHIGSVLVEVMMERRISVSLRRQAINFIGQVGFIDAIPQLERLIERLESRSNGQRRMPFAPPSDPDEASLLTGAQATLAMLKEP